MESGTVCYHTSIDRIAPGTIFAAAIGDQITFCLTVAPEREGYPCGLLALSPGHPMLRNRVGLLNGSVIGGRPLLVYPNAWFVPSPHPSHLLLDSYGNPPVGSLVLRGSQFAIIAETGQGQHYYDCRDGERLGGSWRGEEKIAFTSWEVMIEGPGGEPHTVCLIDTSKSPERQSIGL